MCNDIKPFIISVSGISGGGKTTIVSALQEILHNTEVISFDSYDDMLHKDFFDWSDRGADYNEWDLSPMINDVQKAIKKNPEYILLDYPFGYGNTKMANYIDFAVYVDTPLDIAMARRIIRDYTERSPDRHKIDNLFENLNSSMKAYLIHDRSMYTQHIDTVKPYCNFIADGTKAAKDLAKDILEAVTKYKEQIDNL